MSDEVRERGCDAYADDLAELALGVLTGRARAQALSHVESCPRCAEELEQLSRVADTVVQVAPEWSRPWDSRCGSSSGWAWRDVRRGTGSGPSRWVPAVVAAAAAALALGLGLTLTVVPGADCHRAGPPREA